MYAASVHIYGYSIYGKNFVIYLTSWCAVLQTVTLIHLLLSKSPTKLTKKLLITSWSIGWGVVILFWCIIFPTFNSKSLPPVPLYIGTHGGIHLFIVYFFLKANIKVTKQDLSTSLWFCFFYFVGMIVPLKFAGVTVYPHFLEKFWATFFSLFGTFSVIILAFFAGLYLKSSKNTPKIREKAKKSKKGN